MVKNTNFSSVFSGDSQTYAYGSLIAQTWPWNSKWNNLTQVHNKKITSLTSSEMVMLKSKHTYAAYTIFASIKKQQWYCFLFKTKQPCGMHFTSHIKAKLNCLLEAQLFSAISLTNYCIKVTCLVAPKFHSCSDCIDR